MVGLREEVVVRFTSPWYALLFIPIIVGLYWSWRHVFGMAKSRKRFAFIVRAILAGLMVFAMMEPETHRPNRGVVTMFVIDRSDSISDQDRKASDQFVNSAFQSLRNDDIAGVVAFGTQPVLDSAPGGRRVFNGVKSKIDGSGSNLAAAVRLAAATMPSEKGRRIVIVSDGNETRGDLAQAVEVGTSEGITIDVVALGSGERKAESAIVELRTPSERRNLEPFEARVVVESSVAQTAILAIDRDGTEISRQRVSLDKGKTTIVLDQKLENPGFYRYGATLIAPSDSDLRNNIGASFTTVRGKPKVLLVQGDHRRTELANALRNQGIDVSLFGPEGVPVKSEQLQPYDTVILNDLNAQLVTMPQMKLLQAAVRDTGVGFAMVGGENSFLPGGWYGTPVAEALPVDLNIRQRKSYPSTTVLIVVDGSGSMGVMEDGVQKIQLAAKAAEETVKLLSPLDRLGVAGSTDGIEYVARIQELKDKNAVISQVRKLRPGMGGIYAEPSVKFADKELTAQQTKVKHFLLLADGNDVDTYGTSLDVISKMKDNKITTSVVAIGDGKDVPFLKLLANAGGGRFYLATKAAKLPAIFTQDVALMSRSAIEELVFVPEIRGGDEIVRGFSNGDFPALMAYCLADARPLARVGLVSPKKDPILATWQYGLGSSLAFTSDAQARWAARWVGWDGFGRFWAQAVRSIARKATLNDYQMSVGQAGGRGVVNLKATDRLGNPIAASELAIKVSNPDGNAQDVVLTQEAPGEFSGSFPASDMGSYIVTVSENATGGEKRVSSSGFSVSYSPEYRNYRTNTPLLNSVTEISGGSVIKKPEEAVRPIANPGETISELWPLCVFLACLILPFDVAVRRLALPFAAIMTSFWYKLSGRKRPQPVVVTTVARLQQAKVRANTGDGTTPPEEVPSVTPVQRNIPAPPEPTKGHVSAATKLLEERRKRKQEEEP